MSQDVCNGRCIGHASELSTSEWKPDPACPLHGTGPQPAQPESWEAVLVRFGLQWNGPREFVSTPMVDGYWTPWHIAHEALTAAQQRIAYCIDLFDAQGGFDKAAPIEALVRSALSTIKSLKTERDDLQRRLEDGLDAWRKNNAHHAAEIDRLKREVERLSGEREPPHCRSCRCGSGILE